MIGNFPHLVKTPFFFKNGASFLIRKYSSNARVENVAVKSNNNNFKSFRNILFGFFSGLGISGIFAYSNLFKDINSCTEKLNTRIEEVFEKTNQIKASLDKIQTLEKDLETLKQKSALAKDLEKIRDDVENTQQHLSLSFAQHKASIWEMQQDIYGIVDKIHKEVNQNSA
eukprot:Sdes_comp9016_c0_seq1m437